MKASLAYRIATMEPVPFEVMEAAKAANNIEHFELSWKFFKKKIGRCVKINATNVHEFISRQNKMTEFEKDVPSFFPPFGEFFLEWTDCTDLCGIQIGLSVTALRPTPELIGSLQSELGDKSQSIEWVLQSAIFSTASKGFYAGRPVWGGDEITIVIDSAGKYLFGVAKTGLLLKNSTLLASRATNVLGMSISFMHCKNVIRTEHRDYSSPQAVKRNNAPTCIKYYTLNINPMKEVLRTEGQSESLGLKRALHICRGHFSTYSEDKPLFGKYAGTFWVPDHVRGKAENGVVVKDYKVDAPS